MNYFVAPRSGERSYKNFESTIKHGVPLSRISELVTTAELQTLSEEEVIYAWGNRKGTASAWQKMNTGDLVIFYAHKKLVMSGEVYLKIHNPALALALWPADENGNPWEYVFFIKNLKYFTMPIEIFNDAVGYKLNNIIQGFTRLSEERVESAIRKYGSVEEMLGLFGDEYSVEQPKPEEKIYVNIPQEVTPILSTMRVVPQIPTTSASKKKKSGFVDFDEKHKRNAKIGSLGEEIVMKHEKDALLSLGRPDLAARVTQLSLEDTFAGFDIVSYDADGNEKFIEVKATSAKQSNNFSFYISRNEKNQALETANYYIYLVYDVRSSSPSIHIIENPFKDGHHLNIEPISFRVKGRFEK
jgi:hypothetical protein